MRVLVSVLGSSCENLHKIDILCFGALPAKASPSDRKDASRPARNIRSRCGPIVCQQAALTQSNSTNWCGPPKNKPEELRYKGTGRPKDLSLPAAFAVACGYMRQDKIR